MLRLVTAMYLMIVTAAGPAACCCTLMRIATRLASSAFTTVPQSASCCHAPVKNDSKEKPAGRSPSDHPKGPRCPCRQACGSEIVALPETLGEALQSAEAQFYFLSAIAADLVVPQTCVSSVHKGGLTTAPGLSTADLLYAFHMLRC